MTMLAALAAVVATGPLGESACAAEAEDPAQDMYWGPSKREVLKSVGREQRGSFFAVALGSAVGLLCVGLLHAAWGRSPAAARVIAPIALSFATARLLGLYLIHERLSAQPIGALSMWLFVAAAIPLVYRGRVILRRRKSMSWLRVRARPEPAASEKAESPKRGAAPEAAEAERAVSEALAELDRGDVAAAEKAFRRSIEINPTKRAHTFLGTLLGARGEAEEALAELDRALALAPSYSEALDEKARVLRSLGREDEAAAVRRGSRAVLPGGAGRPSTPKTCPACGKEVPPGAASCECGATLDRCSRCGRTDVPLRAHEGELLCAGCRTKEAAGHSKGPGRLKEAMAAGGPPPWYAAAAFAGAVVAGAVLSWGYVGWREFRAARALGGVVEDTDAALSSTQGPGARPESLELRRLAVAGRDGFVRDRAAMLKIALAIHGLKRSEELSEGEPGLARVAREWAARRLTEARNSLQARDREELPEGFDKAFESVTESLDRLIKKRRWLADDLARRAAAPEPPTAAADVERDWRKIWKRPEPGTRFFIECFRRASGGDKSKIVGRHRDGSPLVAVEFFACRVVESETAGGFALAMNPVPFLLEKLDDNPGPYPPKAKLVWHRFAGYLGRASYRLEFGADGEFVALHQGDAKGLTKLLVTHETMLVPAKLPYPNLPLFAPGIDKGWEQDEKLLWPYPDAEPTRGPCVRQIARWRLDDDGDGLRIGVRWQHRYMTRSHRSSQTVMQNWTTGRPWWNIYDDGEYFFRTRFDAEAEGEE